MFQDNLASLNGGAIGSTNTNNDSMLNFSGIGTFMNNSASYGPDLGSQWSSLIVFS
jgi:predicted outer membrane repeat protein